MSRYEDQYRAWVDSLSDKQRAKLKAKGLDKPLDDFKLNTPDSEIAFAKMGEEFDYDQFDEREAYAEIKTLVEERAKAYGAQLLSWVFARLQAHKSARSACIDRDALVFALGMARLEGRTETAIAAQYGITKAAFSVRVKSWQKLLGLSPVYAKRESVSGIPQCAVEKFDTPLMVCRRNFQSLQKSTNFTPKPNSSRNRQRIQPRRQYPLPSSAASF